MTRKDYISMVDRAKQLSYEYYVLAQPTASDAQFDTLVSEIEQAESEHPEWTLADSPTQQVGSDLSGNGKRLVRHRTPMLSCQKAQTQEAVTKWLAQTEKKLHGAQVYALEWKYDGISCSLVYQDGQLISAATRGDKDCGQDLLAHVMRMPSVPQHINMTGRVEVRGEVVCPKAELTALGYKDCRTAAAALTNQVVPTSEVERLVFIAWQMDVDDAPIATESMSMVTAQVHRFIGEYCECKADEICAKLDEFEAQRDTLPYPTDGVVIKIDEKFVAQSLGATEHHPKGNIAYKFGAQKTVTRVLRIEVSVGATGKRTPVAYLEPVMIMGREVKQASLYSEKKMAELGVTEGCLVDVGLSNDVTPKVYRVIDENSKFKIQNSKLDEPEVIETTTDNTDCTDNYAEPEVIETTTDCTDCTDNHVEPEVIETTTDCTDCTDNEPLTNNRETITIERPRRKRKPRKPRVDRQEPLTMNPEPLTVRSALPLCPAKNRQTSNTMKAIGMVAAMTVALVIIWHTGLLIPLGLIGLAMNGILK